MFNSMKKILITLTSIGFVGIASTSVVACSAPNDLQKAFNINNNVKLDNKDYTLANLGLSIGDTSSLYNFEFNKLDSSVALKIVKVKPNQAVTALYFQGTYPATAPSKNLEIAELSGLNYYGPKGLPVNNNIVAIPLTVSLLVSYENPLSDTGFSYEYTSLIMNIKINVTLK